jgi:hypothetical protein
MATLAATLQVGHDRQPLPAALEEAERRIRWERQPDDSQRLVIQDADTGKVLAVVGNLFDICPH